MEAFAEELIARLDVHLAEHPFLLGGRPGIGDFAMLGTLWAHLHRDPGSTSLYDDAPHMRAWFERLLNPSGTPGEFLPNDQVPETTAPASAARLTLPCSATAITYSSTRRFMK